jgi:NYN domain-containing protein
MQRRLLAYEVKGVHTYPVPLRYEKSGHLWRGREKGVDVRIALDLLRLGQKGLYDVAIVVSEDSDLNEAINDVYELRDHERWIAVENALPWTTNSHAKWLTARRKRRIDKMMFSRIEDRNIY